MLDMHWKPNGHAFPHSLEIGDGFGQQGICSDMSAAAMCEPADGTCTKAASATDALIGPRRKPSMATRCKRRKRDCPIML